jgi:hypothetical protein
MKKHDDYILGSQHFWVHFSCGLMFGGLLGAWYSWQLFDSTTFIVIGMVITALVVAYCCGRWGDSAWHWIIERLPWLL